MRRSSTELQPAAQKASAGWLSRGLRAGVHVHVLSDELGFRGSALTPVSSSSFESRLEQWLPESQLTGPRVCLTVYHSGLSEAPHGWTGPQSLTQLSIDPIVTYG